MAHAQDERDHLLTEARAAHRAADRERNRVRKLAGRLTRKIHHTLAAARAQLDAERAEFEARVVRFNAVQSEFNATAATARDQLRAAWAELDARQSRMTAEHDETNRFHADQAKALDARAAELTARETTETYTRATLQREVAGLREEAAALDARARTARQLVDELEQRRAELRAETLAPAPTAAEPPPQLFVALDRTADHDIGRLAAELTAREQQLNLERAAVHGLYATVSAEKETLADRRRVLAEQFADLARARAQWQEAERATVAEMEHLARSLRRRETELDAREARLARADARRRADAYDLWQFRLRLEAWQSKLVAYEMRWHTERERIEADFARRAALLPPPSPEETATVPLAFVVPEEPNAPAVPAELTALREELERLAVVLLDAELPEPPDVPESELPWGAEEAPVPLGESDGDVLLFDSLTRAA